MTDKLYFVTCRSLQNEAAAAIAAEGWSDVFAAAFPTRCDQPPLRWEALGTLLPGDCTQVVVLGQSCVNAMGKPPSGFVPTRVVQFDNCFHLLAGAQLVNEAIAGGGYLVTPTWLANWRENLEEMGFQPDQAGNFFHGFAKELVLLDTGTDPAASAHLADFKELIGLHARRIAVGLDHTRLLLARLVLEWRLQTAQRLAGT